MITLRNLLFTILVMTGGCVSYEEPRFELIDKIGVVEIRKYQPSIVAETTVTGNKRYASTEGFRRLGGYIFGNNQNRAAQMRAAPEPIGPAKRERISMTAPVEVEAVLSEKIAMTAPVELERVDASQKHVIRFTMPSQYQMSTLPLPNDPRVLIKQRPGGFFAAVRYSGFWSQKNDDTHEEILMKTLAQSDYKSTGQPVFARYDSPYTLWFLRRNEVLVPVDRVRSKRP